MVDTPPTPSPLAAPADTVNELTAARAAAAAAPTVPPTTAPALWVHPTLRFMLSHPAHIVALGAGAGLTRHAPGTAGTLWAWASFALLQPWLGDAGWALLIGLGTLVGWWACTVTARHMGMADSGHIVIDEVLAFWLVLWLVTPASFWAQLVAFLLFRLFDAVKVGPMAWADRRFKGFGPRGGFGILLDDFVAALCTLLVIALWRY